MSNPSSDLLPAPLLEALAAGAEAADTRSDWPADSWALLRDAGVLAWGIPPEYGGRGLCPRELLAGYERLAGACLTTTFLLSQREAAVRRMLGGSSPALCRRFLPAAAMGERYLTVGLSQLTTSRQHRSPALVVTPRGPAERPEAYRLDGEVPWVSGGDRAAGIVTGAVLPDGRQVLFVLPKDAAGLSLSPPLPLTALAGSRTCSLRLDGVELGRDWLLAGPAERVLGKGGGGGLETSCLALGLAAAALGYLEDEAASRPDVGRVAEKFRRAHGGERERLHALADGAGSPEEALRLRVACTSLALRASQAALTVSKGAGFVAPHPAQRWARQALFFLVWSCPRPVAEDLLVELTPP
jgi:alkylation response protein AidB-like acyl-CoA dehydrogenase